MTIVGAYPGATTFPGADIFPGPAVHYLFVGPTTTVQNVMEGRLYSSEELGLNVRQSSDGVWHNELYTGVDELADATAFYSGGYQHRLNTYQRAALVAGGYGAYITQIAETT